MAQEKKIIFVCEHGAAKSVIAASYFNKLARERNLDYVAECRGVTPDAAVSASAAEGLTEDKMFDPDTKPQRLSTTDTLNAERIILFTALPPDTNRTVKVEDWSHIENLNADYPNRRNAIVKKINQLLDLLEKT